MPMTVTWANGNRQVMHLVCVGDMDWAELDQALAEVATLLDSVSHRVDAIVLAEGFRLPPDTPFHYPAVIRKRFWRHPNLNRTVIVGADHFFAMMMEIFMRTYGDFGVKLESAQSLDEANRMLNHHSR